MDNFCADASDASSNTTSGDTNHKPTLATASASKEDHKQTEEQGSTLFLGHEARRLEEEEVAKLMKDTELVSDFKQNKLEKEAQKNWDIFYKRNTTRFFKDRHWTKREFDDLITTVDGDSEACLRKTMFEVGCGVGNFMFPLLKEDDNLFFYACDFSPRAVQFVKEHPQYEESRCHAFQWDITQPGLEKQVPEGAVDVATLIFVLSAIHPDKMATALKNVAKTLKPGSGVLLFRDYGLYDYAMLRFAPGHKLSEHFYVRQDGTRAFYFTIERLQELAVEAGLVVVSCDYVQRQTVNKKEGLSVPRIFVQAKFTRPKVI